MNAREMAYRTTLQNDGWRTKSSELDDEKTHETDIIAYNPQTGRMFYANLTYLSDHEEANLIP